MAPVLRVLGIAIQTYPLAILLAAAAGLWMANRAARAVGVDENRVYDLGFYALLGTVLGARLVYAALNWRAYLAAPLSLFSLTPTALSWPGGAALGVLVGALYWRRHRLPLGPGLDALAPGFALALAIERLGAFLGGRDLGMPTTLPWGVRLVDQVRHPVQLYEAAALLAILGLLWRRRTRRPFGGYLSALFVVLYATLRLVVEPFRAQAPLLPGGLFVVQPIALAVALVTLWGMVHLRFRGREGPVSSEETGP
ncbi:MAG: prolipoprotein diacylglyceryl transferase [Anaerolineae bacterium]|nr:prolipoprotein diacylglyceryl transferase [Anaerolineae bacterium]